jgi:hypothetical protein
MLHPRWCSNLRIRAPRNVIGSDRQCHWTGMRKHAGKMRDPANAQSLSASVTSEPTKVTKAGDLRFWLHVAATDGLRVAVPGARQGDAGTLGTWVGLFDRGNLGPARRYSLILVRSEGCSPGCKALPQWSQVSPRVHRPSQARLGHPIWYCGAAKLILACASAPPACVEAR